MTSTARSETTLYRYRFGVAEFDESRFTLTVSGLAVDLEQKPLQVLAVLLRQVSKAVSREDLYSAVWAGRVTVDQVLTNAVAKLRKALGEREGGRIVTLPRTGYRFEGPVERTAVGARFASRLDLEAGEPVPGRERITLQSQLSVSVDSEVWLAKDTKTGELCVFKFCHDAERVSTLKREATLYRVLRESLGERDDLVRILDWNFETSPYYLESEYGGPNLVRWAQTDGALAALSRDDRLALFLQIADTVAAAHAVGVLHKDLKPTNVLVSAPPGARPKVRLIDFGSGRLLEPGRLAELGITQLGMTVVQDPGSGTPLYLAPEIIAGRAPTIQSDVYALGLILYQLLVADVRRPMAPGWENEIGDPLLAADIGAATHGDPAKRLNNVPELTARLRSLGARRDTLRDTEAALARARSAEQALERWHARRPWVLAALIAMVLGLLVSVSLYRRERLALLESQSATRRADRAAARADEVSRFLADDLLGAADPAGPGGAHNPSMRDVLARSAATVDTRFADAPETKASIELALSSAYFGLADYSVAEKYRRSAVNLLTGAEGPGSTATLIATYELASILVATNRLDEAATMLDNADRLAGPRLDENTPLAYQAHWARAGYDKLRMNAAAAATQYALADRIRAVVFPDNDTLLLRLHDALSWCYVRLGRKVEAEAILRDLVTPAYPPQRVGPLVWAEARIDYGIAIRHLGKNQEAEQFMSAALQELRTALGPDHFFVAVAENELGDLYTEENRWSDAAHSLRDAHDILIKRDGPHGQATLVTAANLGIVQYHNAQYRDAETILAGVHDDFTQQLGAASPQAQITAFYLASTLSELHQTAAAAQLAGKLQPADLASAEPRDDWPARLEALRAALRANHPSQPNPR